MDVEIAVSSGSVNELIPAICFSTLLWDVSNGMPDMVTLMVGTIWT
jgi:hypothetical protein